MIITDDRVLLNNGVSIISIEDAAKHIIKHGSLPEYLKVEKSFDAKLFEEKYGECITAIAKDEEINVEYSHEIEYGDVLKKIAGSHRHQTESKAHVQRFADELEFFEREGHTDFLCVLDKLVERFKADNVVWGVGRGSSCASYILYLLEVHDIDPVKYNINFSEFSKEEKDD